MSRKNSRKKTDSISPSILYKNKRWTDSGDGIFTDVFFCGEFQGILKPALGMRCSIHSSSFQLSSIAQRALKKKTLGRGKQKVRVKRACVGAPKRPPSLTKRPWTQRVRGSLAPLATKDAVKIPQKGAANMPPRKGAPPGPHSGEGLGRSPLPTSV